MHPLALVVASLVSAAPQGAPPCPSKEDKPDVAALLRRTEDSLQGRSTVATMTMTITTPSWKRSLKLKSWARGQDFALVRVVEGGPRETGLLTLKREKQLWTYLPKAGRVMKLPSGMMGDAWLGSDLTNDDLVRGSSIVTDFESTVDGTDTRDGRGVWKVTLTPKKGSLAVWGRVELTIDRETCVPVDERFFDDQGKLARRIELSELRELGWRRYPARMVVTPAEEGRRTEVRYESLEFDVDIPDSTFSLNRLQQGR